jgi:superfamily I DNA/RNA helicase
VLARTNASLESVERNLTFFNLPYRRLGNSRSFYQLPWIKQVLDILKKYDTQKLSQKRMRFLAMTDQSVKSLLHEIIYGAIDLKRKFINGREEDSSAEDDWKALIAGAENVKGIKTFLRNVEKMQNHTESDNAVTLSTVHRAKGLEWHTVYCVGVTDRMMPHPKAEDPEEERRILFVMVTRAAERLVVSCPTHQFGKRTLPSPFLARVKWW